jgi:tRNA modification GTPase
LLDQLQGALRRELAEIAHIAAVNAEEARNRLQALLDRSRLGLHLTTAWRIVLAGRPNVGKSSLINALLGYTRAIVFEQPGTTRDVVTATGAIDGWPVEFSDTAGLRDASDALEAAGIERARDRMAAADLLLLVFDRSQPWTGEDAALLARWPQAIVVYNKSDLPAAEGSDCPRGIVVSALTRQGMDELLDGIARQLVPAPPAPGSAVPFTQRQVQLLRDACRLLERGELLDFQQRLRLAVGTEAGKEELADEVGA